MKIIDISGFGHSGKTAVSDLLREIEGVHAHDHSFEFGLMRLPDGILDLEYHLCSNWSPIRSDRAIKRFRQLCQRLSCGYNRNLTDSFLDESEKYLSSLIEGKIYVKGWFDVLYDAPRINIPKEVFRKLGLLKIIMRVKSLISSPQETGQEKAEVFLTCSQGFVQKTKTYLNNILCSSLQANNTAILTNNVMEPFSPSSSIRFFDDAYSVIVQRDPRDIYASVLRYEQSFVPEFELHNERFSPEYLKNLKQDMLGMDDIETFIIRQKVYKREIDAGSDSERVIRINYEDLVLNYDATVSNLFKRLKIDASKHLQKKKFFDPKQSSQNVGMWKILSGREEIKRIENALPNALYDN